ncbi:hypothetical protein JTB14_017585 [Gonioctena quinquepunctata]|nr:hypothetical protein JTB14_017585 [Gonioctena quinquepunctata]
MYLPLLANPWNFLPQTLLEYSRATGLSIFPLPRHRGGGYVSSPTSPFSPRSSKPGWDNRVPQSQGVAPWRQMDAWHRGEHVCLKRCPLEQATRRCLTPANGALRGRIEHSLATRESRKKPNKSTNNSRLDNRAFFYAQATKAGRGNTLSVPTKLHRSISLPNDKKRKVVETSLDSEDPYKMIESPEAFTLIDTIKTNQTLITALENPNTHNKRTHPQTKE